MNGETFISLTVAADTIITVRSAQSTPLFIDQTGLERRLYNFAHNQGFDYGLATVLMAIAMGWLSSLLFRRPV